MKKIVKLSEPDFEYLIKIKNTLKDFEERMCALEITKLNVFEEYKQVRDIHVNFANQLRDKYNLPNLTAEIDEATQSLVYDEEENAKPDEQDLQSTQLKTEVNKKKKNRQ